MTSKLAGLVNAENVVAINQAIADGQVRGNFFPSVYVVEPTSKCNLSCVMCPNPQMPQHNLGSMDESTFKAVIDKIAPYAEFVMLYWMGEPLLHSQICSFLEYARSKIEGKVVLSSNMSVIDNEIVDSIVRNVDMLLCSLDRFDARDYERIRRGAKFEGVVANIELVLERLDGSRSGLEVVVKALDLAQDTDEYRRFDEHWRSRGALPMLAWLNDWAGTFPSMRNGASVDVPRSILSRSPCADLWFKMVINWRGNVQICCFDWNYDEQIGQVGSTESWLSDIWQGSTIASYRQMHLAGELGATNRCEACETWGEPAEHVAYTDWNDDSYFIVF